MAIRISGARQRIDAPREAFGDGRGLQALGQGLAGLGAGLQVAGEAADQRKEDALREAAKNEAIMQKAHSDRLVLQYDSIRQSEAQELQSRRGVHAGSIVKEYQANSSKAMETVLKDVKDPNERRRLMLKFANDDLKRERTLFTHQNSEVKQVAQNDYSGNYRSSEASAISNYKSLELYGDNVSEWIKQWDEPYAANGQYGLSPVLGKTSQQVNEDIAESRKNIARGVIGNLEAEIINQESEEAVLIAKDRAFNIVDQFTNLEAKEREEIKKRLDSKAKAMIKRNDDAMIAVQQNEYVTPYTDRILDPANSSIESQDAILRDAKSIKGKFPTKEDPNGNIAYNDLVKMSETLTNEQQAINALDIKYELQTNGPEAARLMLRDAVRSNAVNRKQVTELLDRIEKGYDAAIKPAMTELTQRVKKLAQDGKLYSARLESDLPTGLLLMSPVSFIAQKVGEEDEFEPLDLKAGNRPSKFDLVVPFASDWDENQIDGEDVEEILRHVEQWADKNNITDGTVLRNYFNQILFPKEKAAARKHWRSRLVLEELDSAEKSPDEFILESRFPSKKRK
jgi:hypothetical protein